MQACGSVVSLDLFISFCFTIVKYLVLHNLSPFTDPFADATEGDDKDLQTIVTRKSLWKPSKGNFLSLTDNMWFYIFLFMKMYYS